MDGLQAYNVYLPITKSNTINFDGSVSTTGQNVRTCDAIYIGSAGTLVAVAQDGSLGTFEVVAGTLLPIAAIRVNSTNTDAADFLALYYV